MNLRLTCEPEYTNEDLHDIEMALREANLPRSIAEPVLIAANLGLKLIYMNWGCWSRVETELIEGGADYFQSIVTSPVADTELSEEQVTAYFAVAYDFACCVAHRLAEAQPKFLAMAEFALENGFDESYQNDPSARLIYESNHGSE